MSICILFILFNGSGYITPACYDGYELITPHNVAFVQHVPSEYNLLYESPNYYLNYYWSAREKYCRNYSTTWERWSICDSPRYLSTVYYYNVPYRVRYNVRRHLRINRHHYYPHKHSYKKHRRHKYKYKNYNKHHMKHNKPHMKYKKHPRSHRKNYRSHNHNYRAKKRSRRSRRHH